jgi:hypothetical protein
MRNHSERGETLGRRFRLTRRAVPVVGRTLLVQRGAAPIPPTPTVSLRLVIAVDARQHLTRRFQAVVAGRTTVERISAPGRAVRSSPLRVPTAPQAPVLVTTNRPASPVPTRPAVFDRRPQVARLEPRVPMVTGNVARSATAAPVPAEPGRAPAPTAWPPATSTMTNPAGRASVTGPDIATITNQVMSALDQRLIAYGERLGRG